MVSMKPAVELQPDQRAADWDDHVEVYETVFEPLSLAFARRALALLDPSPGETLIDVGAGNGGTALIAAERGAKVLAVDVSKQMIERVRERAAQHAQGRSIRAEVMDGAELAVPDASFAAAISAFGVILFRDAEGGVREIARVLKPGGRVALLAWTEPERYELMTRLLEAVAAVRGPQPPPASLPPQLRFREPDALRRLLESAGLAVREIVCMEEQWVLPSARWIAERMAFAPGMTAFIASLGSDRRAILEAFVAGLERDQGKGEISFCVVAHAGLAAKPGG
jgi:ubiquinone/menaquinone biosynthesis C-methylase UbiE